VGGRLSAPRLLIDADDRSAFSSPPSHQSRQVRKARFRDEDVVTASGDPDTDVTAKVTDAAPVEQKMCWENSWSIDLFEMRHSSPQIRKVRMKQIAA